MMANFKWVARLAVLLMCVAVAPVLAQETINLNQTLVGTIPEGEMQVVFLFNAEAGQEVQVELISVSEGLALLFYVTDANGALVRAVGNPTLADPLSDRFSFRVAGQHTIIVASANGVVGDFVIRMSAGGAPPTVAPTAMGMTCPTVVDEALSAVDAACSAAGRNQACVGNVRVEAQPRSGAPPFSFQQRGDIAQLADLDTLTAFPMDVSTGAWGVALLRVQANLPDTLPGQNVIMLVFGDVVVQNGGGEAGAPVIPVTVTANANVRTGPGTHYAIYRLLSPGTAVTADGRLADNSWLRIQLPDGTLAWVFAPLVSSQSDLSALQVLAPDDSAPAYGPMQVFYFRTGVGEAACAEAPASGILIQTPQGVGEIRLRVNEVNVVLSSTAYLRAQASEQLIVSTLEGQAQVEAFGSIQVAVEGAEVRVPMDAELRAAGPPQAPEPIELDDLRALPVELLPDPITLPQPVEGIVLPTLPTSGACVLATATEGSVNLRSGPGTGFSIRGSLDPTQLYPVAGRTSDRSWFQLRDGGWVASSVTRQGGDCGTLPVTYIPPTATPIPATATPAYRIAGDNEYPNLVIGYPDQVSVSGAISFPEGDWQDTITYRWANTPHFFASRSQFRYSISCTGDGYEYAEIRFSNGAVEPCEPTAYNFVQILSSSVPSSQQRSSDTFTIALTGGDGAFVDWHASFGWFIP